MKKMAEYKTVTYQFDEDVFVDIVTKPINGNSDALTYVAYLYRGYRRKVEMCGMDAADTTKAAFIKEIEADVPMYLEYYDRTEEWFSEIPEGYYDDIDEEYGMLEREDCDDDHDDHDCCDCDLCAMAKANQNGVVLLPELYGTDKEREAAKEIRNGFIKFMGTDFHSKYTTSVTAFVNWYVNTYDDAKYWIAYKDSFEEMFFIIDRIQEWRNSVA